MLSKQWNTSRFSLKTSCPDTPIAPGLLHSSPPKAHLCQTFVLNPISQMPYSFLRCPFILLKFFLQLPPEKKCIRNKTIKHNAWKCSYSTLTFDGQLGWGWNLRLEMSFSLMEAWLPCLLASTGYSGIWYLFSCLILCKWLIFIFWKLLRCSLYM